MGIVWKWTVQMVCVISALRGDPFWEPGADFGGHFWSEHLLKVNGKIYVQIDAPKNENHETNSAQLHK